MKIISYKFLSCEVNRGTEEEPNIEQVIFPMKMKCKTQTEYDANYPIAEKEAIPGTLDLDPLGEFDPEPEAQPSDAERIAELEEALDMLLNGVTE